MSRIHEALKKAAQERTAQLSATERSNLAAVSADIHRSVLPSPAADRSIHSGVASETGQFLCFDELVKRCACPGWRQDPYSLSSPQRGENSRIAAESFARLRSRLSQFANAQPLRRVLVTSSVSDEGKTFVAANLAQSIVLQPEKRVLVIDADLRSPRAHEMFEAPATPGLANYLQGEADEFSIIQRGPNKNLCFIPSGQRIPNPSELLGSEQMKKLLNLVTPAFDWVIIDSPPTLPVHDASVLADLCDGVLFVIRAGETDYQTVGKGVSEFRNKNLIGVVMNRVEKADAYGCYYAYPAEEGSQKQTAGKRVLSLFSGVDQDGRQHR